MQNNRLPIPVRLIIFVVTFVVFYFVLMWVGNLIYRTTNIWDSAAAFFGDTDTEGFILLSLGAINLIAAYVVYRILVNVINRRINKSV